MDIKSRVIDILSDQLGIEKEKINMDSKIADDLGADSLGYLDVDGMVRACGLPENKFCLACFTGDYPVPFTAEDDKEVLERRRLRSVSLVPEEETRQGFLL